MPLTAAERARLDAFLDSLTGQTPPPYVPPPVTPQPPPPPPPGGTTTLGAHLANVISLYNRDTRGRYLSAAYLLIYPTYNYKSRLEPLIRDALFGGNQQALAQWADKESYTPPPYNGAPTDQEFAALRAMALQADALPG